MIKVNDYTIKPTFFPDGTSQIWKIPEEIINAKTLNIIWNFEFEREIIDLHSLAFLLNEDQIINLYIPYLPYARQDKEINNDNTFNLKMFSEFINPLKCNFVSAFDVHNPLITENLINNFKNIEPDKFHNYVLNKYNPDYFFYPDAGAAKRYSKHDNEILLYGNKYRNQSTGIITDYQILNKQYFCLKNSKVLIIDDLCDGGQTFIIAAKALRELGVTNIGLCISHGVFSKGEQHLLDNGIDVIYTTNSILKNKQGYKI